MNVVELHQRYIGMWPERVRIDDGYASGSGFMFPTLSQVHDAIEERIDYATDHWGNIFTWSMFQACHGFARELLGRGASEMLTSAVPLKIIDQKLVGNLSGEDWVEERTQYQRL